MYTQFFGLSDIPFSIAPNPQYLFMSARHKEALSHLTSGLGDTGGFVLLTGEVGTGKTTISRCVFEQLSDNTQVAFILNPTLSCLELLATICDELKVRYKKTGATLKYLTDKIQEKLLSNQQENINTILMIDEAQHLQPEVLEQLRLLTNLETDTKKLLQVILIGQPELQQLLQRRDLRQLAQRITARYHLLPLTHNEVTQYISHRLSVADCHRVLFNKRAVAMIHHVSQGIPRIINLLCERALTLAYGDNQSVITRSIVIRAAQQALGPEYHYRPWWMQRMTQAVVATLVICFVGGGSFWLGQTIEPAQDVANLGGDDLTPSTEAKKIKSSKNDVAENNTIKAVESDVNAVEKFAQKLDAPNKHNELMNSASKNVAADIDTVVKSNENNYRSNSAGNITETSSKSRIEDSVSNEATGHSTIQPQRDEQQLISAERKPTLTFDVSKVSGVSESLLAKVQSAVEQANAEIREENLDARSESQDWQALEVRALTDMPIRFQNAIPRLQFDTHIYASDGQGFVKVNDRDRYEGDFISEGLKLVKILPQEVVLVYQGEQFKLPALSNW